MQISDEIYLENDNLVLSALKYQTKIAKFDITLDVVEKSDYLSMTFEYKYPLFAKETIIEMKNYYLQLLDQVLKNPLIKTCQLGNLYVSERLSDYNFTTKEISTIETETISSLFEKRVLICPDEIALVNGNDTMTYQDLNQRANQLASYLINNQVQTTNQFVAIMLDRSFEMFISIFAVLKCNMAYLPIDPNYPNERIVYMMKECETDFIITSSALLEKAISITMNVCDVNDKLLKSLNSGNKEMPVDVNKLAYVIFTSGTTGRPKGVMIEQKNIINMAFSEANLIYRNAIDFKKIAFTSSFIFDESVAFIFTTLLFGSRLYIISEEMKKNNNDFVEYVAKKHIDIIGGTPTFLKLFITSVSQMRVRPSIEKFLVGGEALSRTLVNEFYSYFDNNTELINMYGPTECTVDVTFCSVGELSQTYGQTVPIGKPLPNHKIYILDEYFRQVPEGVIGELYVGGLGLSRGYINQEEITNAKFIVNPFNKAEKIYKTGDLVRLLNDGNIEFVGRSDDQIKIRGYRIELDEIGSVILSYDGIKNAIILPNKHHDSTTLVAFIVAEEIISKSDINKFLSRILPDYMIPAQINQVDEIPINSSGKIDRKLLLAKPNLMKADVTNEEAVTNTQKLMVKVWSKVLVTKKIGIYDNFFSLGGDSIKGIQIAAHLRDYNYKLDMMDLFKYPTIYQLSEKIVPIIDAVDQKIIQGSSNLSPIQKWFFSQTFNNEDHWNQDALIFKEEPLNNKHVKKSLSKLIEHHDALRLHYIKTDKGISAVHKSPNDTIYKYCIVESEQSNDEIINDIIQKAHKRINIKNGPLIVVTHIITSSGDYLHFAIHHLLVDAVSWQLIISDFIDLYNQCTTNIELKLPLKTSSYAEWVGHMDKYPLSSKEIQYWKDIVRYNLTPFKKDIVKRSHVSSFTFPLSVETDIRKTCKIADVELGHLLLSAAGRALAEWLERDCFSISLESHGRYTFDKSISINRTIGWFTSEYPFLFKNILTDSHDESLREVKERVLSIPNYGVGFGILNSKEEFDLVIPNITYNFLGDYRQVSNLEENQFKVKYFNSGLVTDPSEKRTDDLSIDCYIDNNGLHFQLSISAEMNKEYSVTSLELLYKKALQEFITIGQNREIHVVDNILPYNEVFARDCFYHSLIPVIRHFNKSEIPFLFNDIYYYTMVNGLIKIEHVANRTIGELLEDQGLAFDEISGVNNLLNSLKEQLNLSRPVIVSVDSYYIPLRKDMYHEKHWSHAILIYGYDDERKLFYTIEQLTSDSLTYEERLIPYNNIVEAIDGFKEQFPNGSMYPTNRSVYISNGSDNFTFKEWFNYYKERVISNKDIILNGISHINTFVETLEDKFNEKNIGQVFECIHNIIIEKQLDRHKLKLLDLENQMLLEKLEEIIKILGNVRSILNKCLITKKFTRKSFEICKIKLLELEKMESLYFQLFIDFL